MLVSALLALISGLFYVASFAPWDQAYLQWIAFVPLLLAVDRLKPNQKTNKNVFILGFILAFLITAGGFYWVIYATEQFGGLPVPAAVFLFLLFCMTGQLQVPLYLFARGHIKAHPAFQKRFLGTSLVLSLLYTGIEAVYPKLFHDTAGNSFYASSWWRQGADVGGPFFLTTLILFVNELFVGAYHTKKIRYASLAFGMVGLLSLYGYERNEQFQNLKREHSADPIFRASLIQANIGDYVKVASERGEINAASQVMDQYLGMSKRAVLASPVPDAIIWPETAYPTVFQRPMSGIEMQMDSLLRNFLHDLKPTLIFGGYDSDNKHQEYNSLYFINSQGQSKRIYHKSVLLMFGETLPFADDYPPMKSWFPTMGFFGRGPGPEVIPVKNQNGDVFKLAPSICYEGLFTDHSVQGALQGADALLNVTNDSWFGPYGEPYLHLALTRFRTIETRRPMLRATNTGITVWIDEMGNQIKTTELFKPEILNAEIHPHFFPESPYLRVARALGPNWYVRLCEGITLLLVALLLSKRVRSTRFV